MAKKARSTPAKTCECDKCGLVDRSAIPGSTHRRCSGNAEANDRKPKGSNIPVANRGRWN
jgi:hypothetical protein